MTSGERQLADTVFYGAIDYNKVSVIKGLVRGTFLPVKNRMVVRRNRIYYNPRSNIARRTYSQDFSKSTFGAKQDFIHELTHVWQYQQGMNLLAGGILARVASGLTYPYLPLVPGKSFDDYNIEQQGTIAEDYFSLLEGRPTPNIPGIQWFESILPWIQPWVPNPSP